LACIIWICGGWFNRLAIVIPSLLADNKTAAGLLPGTGEEAAILAFASTLTILSFASRAFAFYYFLQCLVAICVTESRAVSKSEGSNWVNRVTGIA
jgi:hypothetical protein